jgi:MFS family permease
VAGKDHLKQADIETTIFAARALRDFGDGFVVLLVPFYLAARGLDAFEIGVIATLGLFGSALTTIGIGFISHRFGERALLIAASMLMAATGLAFAISDITALFFLIAFIGTINPSSGSVSIFVPLEHSLLAGAVPDRQRTTTFARYSLIGALSAAFGSLAAGSPEWLARGNE